jgi:hypothetical protein
MDVEPVIAFREYGTDPPALRIRVNFGVFAGREATPAEIDDLAGQLVPDVGEVSIVSEQRHEISEDVEAALHQVRIEIGEEHLPTDADERERLADRILATAETWTEACIAERHAEVTEL